MIKLLNKSLVRASNLTKFSITNATKFSTGTKKIITILFTLALSDKEQRKNIYSSSSLLPASLPLSDELLTHILQFYNKISIIFIITLNGPCNFNRLDSNRGIYYINLSQLIKELKIARDSKTFEQYQNLIQKSAFFIIDFSWSELVNELKKNDFYLSGGLSTKRHIISTTQRRLCKLLDHLGVSEDFTTYSYHNADQLLIKGDPNPTKKSSLKNSPLLGPFISGSTRSYSTNTKGTKTLNYKPINIDKLRKNEIGKFWNLV